MKYSTLLMAGILSAMTIGCSNNSSTSETPVEPASDKTTKTAPANDENLPTYTIGTVFTYPPFASSNENGQSEGFDIDLMNAIADKQGFAVNYMPADWNTWKEDLDSGKIDVWVAGIAIKEDRKEFTSFTNPYLEYHTVAMLIDNESTKSVDINGLNQFKLAAEKETVDHKLAIKVSGGDESKVTAVESSFKGFELLTQGKVDAVIGNNLVLSSHAKAYPEIKTKLISIDALAAKQEKKELGFMVKKDRTELLDSLNEGLEKVKQDGTYAEITKKWFGDIIK